MSNAEKITSVRLSQGQLKALERIGERDDRKLSWLIRKAIDEFIQRQGRQK